MTSGTPKTPTASGYTPIPNTGYQFQNKTQLQTAVDLWISNKTSAMLT